MCRFLQSLWQSRYRTDTDGQPAWTVGSGPRAGEQEGPPVEMELGHGNGTWERLLHGATLLQDGGERFKHWCVAKQYLWEPPRARAGVTEFYYLGQHCVVWATKRVLCGHSTPGVEVLLLATHAPPLLLRPPSTLPERPCGVSRVFLLRLRFCHSPLVGPQVWVVCCMHGGLKGGVGAAESASGVSPIPGKQSDRGRFLHWARARLAR